MEVQPTSMLKVGPLPSLNAIISANRVSIRENFSSDDEFKDNILVWDEKARSEISQIFISYDDKYIKSFAFQYVQEDGKLELSPIFGCQDLEGTTFETVTFKEASTNEYITRVSGSHDKLGMKSLTIETNVSTYGPVGIIGDNKYYPDKTFQIGLGHVNQFGGFHGTSCTSPECIASIGVYLKPIQDLGALTKKFCDDVHIHQLSSAIY